MKLPTLLIIDGGVAALFDMAFLLVPAQAFSPVGVEARATLAFIRQLLGTAFIRFAVWTWSDRNAIDSTIRRAIVLALIIGIAVGFVVALVGRIIEVASTLGCSTIAICLLLALGFGSFQFVNPELA